jgi:anti-sigma28 factor (negative regulator of flagellin synthesis)
MRIDDLNRSPVTQSPEKTDPSAVQQRPGSLGKDSLAASDHADVSSLALALAAQNPSRIEQLRLEVQSGRYDVSADAVASAIVDAHLTE